MRHLAVAAFVSASLALSAIPARAGWFDDAITEPFLVPADIQGATLSPDGSKVAAILVDKSQHAGVGMYDVAAASWKVVVHADVIWTSSNRGYWRSPYRVNWLTNELLAIDSNDDTSDQHNASGAFISRLGARHVGLIKPDGTADKWVVSIVDRKSGRLVRSPLGVGQDQEIGLRIEGDAIIDWLTDDTGLIRAARTVKTSSDADVSRIATWYRRAEDAPWIRIDERSINDDAFRPVVVDPRDADTLIVQARNGGDRLAMWEFDVGRKAITGLSAGHPTEDIVAFDTEGDSLEFSRVTLDGLKPQTVWFDAHMAAVQQAVDKLVPDRVNVLQSGRSGRVLVYSYSDVDPGRISLLDTQAKTLREIAAERPGIDPKRMQPMRVLHYPSFDGLSIPAYLTLPGKPTKPSPLIVLIHGGPQARDRWGWQQDVQVFAAHGYAVFQPQFRGSTGFGKKFEEAGYGQWGQAMQDDITAGVQWLADQKIVDPARVCIIGASYGGYAALWGLEKTPELYKCGVSTAGVSDLESFLREESDVSKSAIARELTNRRIGDPSLMKVTFDSVSPLKHAERITAPLLVAHGTLDERVPISHGQRMVDAMKAQHKDVEWLEFEQEKHSLSLVENQRKWYEAVFSLLKRTIGKGEPPRGDGAK